MNIKSITYYSRRIGYETEDKYDLFVLLILVSFYVSKYKFPFNCVWVICKPTVSLYYFISGRLLALFDSFFVLALVVLFALYCLILFVLYLS